MELQLSSSILPVFELCDLDERLVVCVSWMILVEFY
jgi:hypothetical protein